jgi:GntR family transcriptional repressor for pyruvate dehydrogenase complex
LVSAEAARAVGGAEAGTGTAVTDRVVGRVWRMIQRGHLRPGDRLPTERDMARHMGVSRHSVRAALQFLTAMGVIRSLQGSGTFVREGPPSLDSEPLRLLAVLHGFTDQEMFEARGLLEVDVAGLSAQRATGEQMAGMSEEVASMFASLDDPSEFLVHDVRFHRAVAGGANNRVIAALVDMVSALLFERRRLTIEGARDLRESAEMHQRIYQAIRRGDPAAARAAMAEHLHVAQEGWAAEGQRLAPQKTKAGPRRSVAPRREVRRTR